jgi:hypothetical protein
MCMASYLPPEIPVDGEGLFNGGVSNPHGHGWAIADPGVGIIMGKSLDIMEAVEGFKVARGKHMNGPALFHSRLATHGSKSLANVHPFMVAGSHLTVVAHNGILPGSAWPATGDDRSDTRLFADEILAQEFGELDKFSVKLRLTKWCGSFNKLVILTVDPVYACNAYLVNQNHGVWDAKTGIWHSNRDFEDLVPHWMDYEYPSTTVATSRAYSNWKQPRKSKKKTWVMKSAKDSAEVFEDALGNTLSAGEALELAADTRCEYCGMGELRHGYCQYCDTCQECAEVYDDCTCYDRYKGLASNWGTDPVDGVVRHRDNFKTPPAIAAAPALSEAEN